LLELNKVYKMDNLELLNQLPNNYIDLIYCDILYNTGRKFKDYNDNLGTPMQAIEWYKPRIEEMYRVLKDTGSIYLHMDYRLVHYMKVLMDEIFGFDNFRNEIIWQRTTNTGSSKSIANKLSNDTDSILYYTKSNKYILNKQYKPYSEDYLKRFKYEDKNGKYRWSCMKTYSQDKLKELQDKDMIRWNDNSKYPEYKQYLDSLKGIPLNNLWNDKSH